MEGEDKLSWLLSISYKIYSNPQLIRINEDAYFILIKGTISQEGKIILNICVSKFEVFSFTKLRIIGT